MAKFNVKKIIDDCTVDEVVDYAKVNEELELQNKNVVTKEVDKAVAKIDKDSIIKSFLLENEFESVDAFNAFKKNGATADTEELKRLKGELKVATETLDTKVKSELGLTNELATYKNLSLLRGKGNLEQDQLEFYEYKINKLEGESFSDKLDSFIETNPDVFAVTPLNNVIKTTGTKAGVVDKDGKLGWEKKLEEKYGEL